MHQVPISLFSLGRSLQIEKFQPGPAKFENLATTIPASGFRVFSNRSTLAFLFIMALFSNLFEGISSQLGFRVTGSQTRNQPQVLQGPKQLPLQFLRVPYII